MPPGRAMWVWMHEAAPPDPAAVAAFAVQQRVTEAFVSVPWGGPTPATQRQVAALRGEGVRVSALGGDPSWTTGDDAVTWMRRATAALLFQGVHLDIEPWTRRDWPGRERALLDALARTVRDVAARTSLPVEVDLAPWLAQAHPREFRDVVARADAVTLMAYRDRASDILASSASARRVIAGARRPYRIGVETGAVAEPEPTAAQTFADEGRAVLERELAEVAARLAGDTRFAGIAVHDVEGWLALRP
ncbi:hypothetical protein [Agrococcus sp. Marseille-Q4369]|uniref:hypothetical protein n=1 Tax=Agrococcus sp. Marseille-Q4369 TaxID=2810513 RepID=UPI001B8B6AE4|nr:hypothetical protein [Agrococcus sp. Marseille-Q4369]QUW18539.1 hypothetical protein JSQ78_12190 [Agrococcus sp. Marseille-Q4369]